MAGRKPLGTVAMTATERQRRWRAKVRLQKLTALDGEISGPTEPSPSEIGKIEREGREFKKGLRGAMRAAFDQMSINRYLAVFGAVPDRPPYRQWLYEGRKSDAYVHIADVWADAALRARVLARLQRLRPPLLCARVRYDLAYLDKFAAGLTAPRVTARLTAPGNVT
jgi:hypothetical protein